jgi:hypothetical protein
VFYYFTYSIFYAIVLEKVGVNLVHLVYLTLEDISQNAELTKSTQAILTSPSDTFNVNGILQLLNDKTRWIAPAFFRKQELVGFAVGYEASSKFYIALVAVTPEFKFRSLPLQLIQSMMVWATRNGFNALYFSTEVENYLLISQAMNQLNFQVVGYEALEPVSRVQFKRDLRVYDLSIITRTRGDSSLQTPVPVLANSTYFQKFLQLSQVNLFSFRAGDTGEYIMLDAPDNPDLTCLYHQNDLPVGFLAGYNRPYGDTDTILSLELGGKVGEAPAPWLNETAFNQTITLIQRVGYRGIQIAIPGSSTLFSNALRAGFTVRSYQSSQADIPGEIIMERIFLRSTH